MKHYRLMALVVGTLVTATAAEVRAQGQSGATATAGSSPTLVALAKGYVGTWEGSLAGPEGGLPMQLVIEADGAAKVKVKSMAVAMGGNGMQELPVRDAILSESDLSWTLEAMGASCGATVVLNNGEMKGSTMCAHGQMLFTLKRKQAGT